MNIVHVLPSISAVLGLALSSAQVIASDQLTQPSHGETRVYMYPPEIATNACIYNDHIYGEGSTIIAHDKKRIICLFDKEAKPPRMKWQQPKWGE